AGVADSKPAGMALLVARADGRKAKRVGETTYYQPVAWAPDSKRIAYVGSQGLEVVEADGSGAHIAAKRIDATSPLWWSPDGGSLAYTRPGQLVVRRGGISKTVALGHFSGPDVS